MWLLVLVFFFLHCEELVNLECAVVEFNVEGLEGLVLNIKFSKTDQFRGGGGRGRH